MHSTSSHTPDGIGYEHASLNHGKPLQFQCSSSTASETRWESVLLNSPRTS
jgi:hypothetical protein